MYDVVIVGSGPAGMTAAMYVARKGLETLIVGKDVGGQIALSGEIENYLGFGSSTGAEVTQKFHEHVELFHNIGHIHGVDVLSIEKEAEQFLVKTTKDTFVTKTVIIASGRKPRHLNVPGEKEYTNKGVSYCDVCDGPLFRGKRVAVIGGGNSALEAALSLARICPTVYVMNLTKKFTGDDILIKKVFATHVITVFYSAKTKRIIGDTFVRGFVYEDIDGNERQLDVEGVFIEVGYSPSTDFDTLTHKDSFGRIVINANCETNIPGIFAAGDVSNIRDNQIITAAGEGAKAALSAYYYLSRK